MLPQISKYVSHNKSRCRINVLILDYFEGREFEDKLKVDDVGTTIQVKHIVIVCFFYFILYRQFLQDHVIIVAI